MKNKQNLHMHTTYCDGKDSPEALILEAIRRGFDSVGFSEHSYMEDPKFPRQLTVEMMGDYKAEICGLKAKYKGTIDVFCGLELDLFSDVPTEGFDYLIGSVHYLDMGGQLAGFDCKREQLAGYIDTYFHGDSMAFAKKYYETICRLPEKGKVDIIGHFDLLTKNNEALKLIDTGTKAYLDMGFQAIAALKGKVPLFEVNTGAIARGYRTTPYPQQAFLREFKRCGFGAVITSDCHDKNYMDCEFEEARRCLKEAGFATRWILTDQGFREVDL